jgi:putative tricarboxylic transport membrane protein
MDEKAKSGLGLPVILPVILIAGTIGYLATALWTAPLIENGAVSASFFPVVISVVMLAASASTLIDALRAREAAGSHAARSPMRPPLLVGGLTAAYVALFEPVGYFIATTAYVLGLLYVLKCRVRHPVARLLIAVAVAGVFYVFYAEIFRLRLPKLGEFI